MSESHTRLVNMNTEQPHRSTQHTFSNNQPTRTHHSSHAPTRTSHPTSAHNTYMPTGVATKPSSFATPSSTGYSYPTPSSVPKSNATIMGLGITVAFLVIILGALVAAIVVKARRARQSENRYSLDSRVETPVDGPSGKFRTWMGEKIEARVPMNGYA